jgi:hypothetical protein
MGEQRCGTDARTAQDGTADDQERCHDGMYRAARRHVDRPCRSTGRAVSLTIAYQIPAWGRVIPCSHVLG